MKKVFILGNPRSGTSLLRIILNCNSKIAATPECGFLQWWHEKYKDWSRNSLRNEDLQNFLKDLFSSKKIETWNLDKEDLEEFLLESEPISYAELTEKIYHYWGLSQNKNPEVIIDKNNYFIDHLSEIQQIWPDAFYLFLVRDGRDVACSYQDLATLETSSPYKPDLPVSIDAIAEEWVSNNLKVLGMLQQLDNERYKKIKFEDLILDTRNELLKICNFLDVQYSNEMLSYDSKNRKNEIEPAATLDWKKKTLEKPDSSKIGRYKNMLNKREITLFSEIGKEVLQEFNYKV